MTHRIGGLLNDFVMKGAISAVDLLHLYLIAAIFMLAVCVNTLKRGTTHAYQAPNAYIAGWCDQRL
jgi:hypothetical protein